MLRFKDDSDALRWNEFLDGGCDISGHAFLNLQAACKNFDQARKFGEADHLIIRQIRDVALPEKWKQVVPAEAVKINVLDDHHFVGLHVEESVVQHLLWIHPITAREEFESFGNA